MHDCGLDPALSIRNFRGVCHFLYPYLSHPILEGAAKAALDCAHRTIYMLPPSLLVISLGMGAD
jgi:hypothetical protein